MANRLQSTFTIGPVATALVFIFASVGGACAKVATAPGAGAGGDGAGDGAGGAAGPRDAAEPRREGGIMVDGGTPCVNLNCQQMNCPDGGHTTLEGTVYAPNGTLPLYNAVVYVPNADVPPLHSGPTCDDQCGPIPGLLVGALTDAHGNFTLNDVPVGQNIPLVIQVGKWRRQVTVPMVNACTANKITDRNLTRLPRNRGEGDMPRIAITSGPCDNLVCMMPKLGIDPAEFGIAGENRAVTFFHGATYDADKDNSRLARLYDAHLAAMTSATDLWSDVHTLAKYDLLIASCECVETPATAAAYDAVTNYLAMGGRVFGTDLQYVWYKNSTDPNLRGSAQIVSGNLTPGASPIDLDTSFPKGQAFADWLSFVNPSAGNSQVSCDQVFDNFSAVSRPAWQVWATSESSLGGNVHPRLLTVNTPVGVPVEQQCGRAVHLDAHVSAAFSDHFPDACGTDLQNGEQALAFFLFDVAACIQDDTKPPPPIIP